MPSLDLRVLVLERLMHKWETGGGSVPVSGITPMSSGRLVGRYSAGSGPAEELTLGTGLSLSPSGVLSSSGAQGSGATNTVGVWQNGTTLTYDALLSYDRVTHRLGVGTATPGYPLEVAGQARISSLGVNAAPATGFGLVTGGNTYLAPNVGIQINPPLYPLDVAGSARITSLGLNRTPDAAYALVTSGSNYFGGATYCTSSLQVSGTTGLAPYTAPGAVYLRSGSASMDSLRLGGGDVAPRWYLDCPGQGHIAQLGVYYNPDQASTDGVDFRTYRARIDTLGCGRSPDTSYALVTQGANYLGGTVQAGGTGIGYAPDGVHWLRSGSAYIDSLGLGQGTGAGYSLVVAGAVLLNYTLYVTNTTQLATYSAVAGAPDNRFVWRMYGSIYCDGIPYNGGGGPWVAFSDRRLKRNIQEISAPLATMCALHGVMYEYNDTAMGKPPGRRLGVIAQEVEQVLPEWVGDLDGCKTTQLSQFEALTIESFKAVVARLEALEQTGWPLPR